MTPRETRLGFFFFFNFYVLPYRFLSIQSRKTSVTSFILQFVGCLRLFVLRATVLPSLSSIVFYTSSSTTGTEGWERTRGKPNRPNRTEGMKRVHKRQKTQSRIHKQWDARSQVEERERRRENSSRTGGRKQVGERCLQVAYFLTLQERDSN